MDNRPVNQLVKRRKRRRKKDHLKRNLIALALATVFLVIAIIVSRPVQKMYMNSAYPKEYAEFVEKYAAVNDLPESLVYAVIYCESGFKPDAVSNVGARGLMQIMEDTFEWIQFRMGEEDSGVTYEDMFDPETNIRYGTYLLRDHLDEFALAHTALCAYHAGRSRVNQWLDNSLYSSDGTALDEVPFTDTRNYARKVLNIQEIYESLYYAKQ